MINEKNAAAPYRADGIFYGRGGWSQFLAQGLKIPWQAGKTLCQFQLLKAMKALFTLTVAALAAWAATTPAAAARPVRPANLTVFAERGQPFTFVLDGRPLTYSATSQVRVNLLAPGRHWADVTVPTAYGRPLYLHQPVWLQPGLETSFMVVLRPYGAELRQVQATPAYGPGSYYGGQPGYPGGYANAPGQPGGAYYPTQPGGAYEPNQPADSPTQYDNGQPPLPGGAYPGGGAAYPGQPYPGGTPAPGGYYPSGPATPYYQPLSPAEVGSLQQSLSQRPFDDDRLSIARQALSQSSVRADELTALLRTLSFDKSRIELAKFGYAHVADQQNFYRVYDALQFSSSIREVQQSLNLPRN